MAREQPKNPHWATAQPELLITPPAFPSGDYSHTLEVVMGMQATVGKLTEAVDTLKDRSKEHSAELISISKDVHAAKVVSGFITLAAGFFGFAAKMLVDYLTKK